MLVCARKFVLHDKLVKNGAWTREHLSPMGHISGQTLGIVGIGNIGRAMGRKAKGLGMNVIAFDPNVSSWDFKEYGIEFVSSINELCQRSDYVSLHCPLLESTRKIMGAEQFKMMKKTAYLINCSRGPVVDEKALIDALNNNEIAGAGLDVFEEEPTPKDNPLLKMENVMVTPHTAGTSVSYEAGVYKLISQETARLLKGMWQFLG
jgi:D-3-phosphoglycerate dehydrogenase